MIDLTALDVLDDEPVGEWRRLVVGVPHRDLRGVERRARAHVLLPPRLLSGEVERAPLLHVAGYEILTGFGALLLPWWMERQPVIVNPVTPVGDEAWPGDNALARGPNLDVALLHLARSLPFVDPARVHVTGHSAGGYTTLQLAAESFPLAGAAPDVAFTDISQFVEHLRAQEDTSPRPALLAVIAQAAHALGEDVRSPAWRADAPIEHLHEITCPVSLVVSTADTLVPIGFLDPLLARLPADTVERFNVPVSGDRFEIVGGGSPVPPDAWERIQIPRGSSQWDVVVLDEGEAEPWTDHLRHAILPTRDELFDKTLADPVGVQQLTTAKLDRLIDRVLGVERAPGVVHLDAPGRERADVVLGLATYAGAGPAHEDRLERLYAALPAERQALGSAAELLISLRSG